MKYRIIISVIVIIIVIINSYGQLVHPGGWHTQSDLTLIRSKIAAGEEPWISGWNAIKDEAPNADYTTNVSSLVTSNGAMSDAGFNAWRLTMKWVASGDQAYADAAMDVINNWVDTVTDFDVYGPTLTLSTGAGAMAQAAEILEYGFNGEAGWPSSRAEAAKTWFKEIIYDKFTNTGGMRSSNWGTSCVGGNMSMAIFCDNMDMFEDQCDAFKYGYTDTDDGCCGVTQYIFRESGQAWETGRDQAHVQGGIAHLTEAALTAWNQRVDLVYYENNRLLAGVEYHAKYNVGYDDLPFYTPLYNPCNIQSTPSMHEGISEDERGNFSPVYCMTSKLFTLAGLDHPYTKEVIAYSGYAPEISNFAHPGWGTFCFNVVSGSAKVYDIGVIPLVSPEEEEWSTYYVHFPVSALYNISINYASSDTNGKIKVSFDGNDVTGELNIPHGDEYSTGLTDFKDFSIANDVVIRSGIKHMVISISGDSASFILNSISIETGSENGCTDSIPSITPSYRREPGINYYYFEGSWDSLPDFDTLVPLKEGLTDSIKLMDGIAADNFALVFEGYIDIPILGSYTFYALSDEESLLLIDGIVIVDNNGLNDTVEESGSICLDEGFHNIRVEYLGKTGSEKLEIMFEAQGISKRTVSGLYGIGPCANLGVTPPDSLVEGLMFSEYSGTWENLPDFDLLTVADRGIASTISTNVASKDDYYGLTFEGFILIEESGEYTFYTSSDDGSRLLIDDMLVVSNDGTHGKVEKSGNLCLAEGYHKIRVEYFENSGGQSLSAKIKGEGFSKSALTNLFTAPLPPRLDQQITFNALDTVAEDQGYVTPGATASSGLRVGYTSSNTNVATIVETIFGSRIQILDNGSTIITASQAGNGAYNAAEDVQQTLVVTELVSGLQDTKSAHSITLCPNPVSGVLTIKQHNAGKAKVEILNSIGHLVMTTTVNQEESMLDISKLPSGIYVARICVDESFTQQIIVKE